MEKEKFIREIEEDLVTDKSTVKTLADYSHKKNFSTDDVTEIIQHFETRNKNVELTDIYSNLKVVYTLIKVSSC